MSMKRELQNPSVCIRLPISRLSPGEVAPPLVPEHESWKVLAAWDDPLAPRRGHSPTHRTSSKTRINYQAAPALEWTRHRDRERTLVTGEPTWREYSVECRLQALQAAAGPTRDGWFINQARAGIVFRIHTSRRHYYFCLEGKRRLVLFRRIDDEWFKLAAQEVKYQEEIITLRVSLDGDAIRAECPELEVELFATDTTIPRGKAGFRALGQCRLFALSITMTPSQEKTNKRLARELIECTAHLGSSVPDEEEAGEIDLSDGRALLGAADFCQPGRNDLLFHTPEGLLATTWEGEELWRLRERTLSQRIVISADVVDSSRRIYALLGEREVTGRRYLGAPKNSLLTADEAVVIDGASGEILTRTKLPPAPEPDPSFPRSLEKLWGHNFSFETGRLVSEKSLDIAIRSNGSRKCDIWAYDGKLNLLWEHHQIDPPYGHLNAVHLFDVNNDGRSEVLAGGTLFSAEGEVLWVHDLGEEMQILGAEHYDAVLVGDFSNDSESDPLALFMGGSAGVYVVDALTGKTRAIHRTGHAQWVRACKVREDLPGEQLLVGMRWGNF